MQIIKNFSVFKSRASENPKAPSHSLSAKIGEEYVNIGSAWTKESKKGDKFLSAKLSDAYVDHTDNTKSRKEMIMCFAEDIKQLCLLAKVEYPLEEAPKQATKSVDAF